MAESQRMVSDKLGEKIIFMPTQRYDVPSRKFGKIFVVTLSVKLDDVRARKWNSERLVVFQSVILQSAQGVNNSKHIHARIFFWLNCWNCALFEKITKDTFNATNEYLGKALGCKIK